MSTDESTAVVFPGQGTQKRGMAQDFYDAHAIARETFERVSDRLELDIAKLVFEEDDRLLLTEYAQPAILTAEIAMFRVLEREFDFAPACFGGHSLGEYTALVAAGAIDVTEAAALVRLRGRLMQEAVPPGAGAMSAVVRPAMDVDALRASIADGGVDIANLNSPDQTVISGPADAVAEAAKRLKSVEGFERARCLPLKVSAPFHSRAMKPAEDAFRPALEEASAAWNAERATAVTSNFAGGFHDADRASVVDRLARQISAPVRWLDNMEAVRSRAVRVVELGPGKPLRAFFAAIEVEVTPVTTLEAAAALAG
jgi:[acyl-carrier-protein] S-malonyltransferase/trans-AT polyketide synthase/acyltransferase/oxidoreductase domain-containing protein